MNKIRLCSIFVLLALLIGFIGASPAKADLIDHPWTGYGTGTTDVVSDGEDGPAQFTYDSWGTFWGDWSFETTALADRSYELYWNYQGLHAWYRVTVQLDAFIYHHDTGIWTLETLFSAGPENCCTPPSNGFNYSGFHKFDVDAGDIYGFKMFGSNYDSNWVLQGTLTVDDQFFHSNLFYFDGNYYELVPLAGYSWESARDFAAALELEGCFDSHLVTITSAVEQAALYGHFGYWLDNRWYGGYQPNGDQVGRTDGWEWITGEEWAYTNWGAYQPDDWMGGEHYLTGWYNNTWNDAMTASGFVVEYECNLPPPDLFYFDNNYYELISAPGLAWETARDFAAAQELEGCSASHLVTITSQEEQDALSGHFGTSLEYKYYGGYQPPENQDLAHPDRGWVWVTGEEWAYTNWGEDQPDDWQGGEHYLLGWYNNTWNDDKVGSGFVIEYECNQPPVADAGGPYTGDEGSSISLDGSASSDPDGDPLTYDWTVDPALCTFDNHEVVSPKLTCTDDGDFTATLTVSDGQLTTSAEAMVTVNNVAPTSSIDSVDPVLVAVGAPVSASGSFTDPGTNDTFSATWDWGDASTSDGSVNGYVVGPDSHTYAQAGIYTIQLTVTDDDDGTGSATYQYVVVYDPTAGFVTGGGSIDSPAGAYVPDPDLTGKATFGFVSKYQKGSNVPTGNTEFQFHVASFNFHSTSYDWLVVTGSNYAKFKGEGTINGEGAYKFMIWAGDGTGEGGADTFRIKIWTEVNDVETIIYDNGMDQAISGGSIMVHAP